MKFLMWHVILRLYITFSYVIIQVSLVGHDNPPFYYLGKLKDKKRVINLTLFLLFLFILY
jgi:hypothetical protein